MLYQIRKKRIAGTFKGRDQLIEGNFNSIEEAGDYLIENSIELFGPNIGLSSDLTGLTDLTSGNPRPIIFRKGDQSVQDGDDIFEISAQGITI